MKCVRYIIACLALLPHIGLSAGNSDELHYNRPAAYFEEALPIGNGTIGAMVYGSLLSERLTLNDITLWTGEPRTQPYAPEAYRAIPEIRAALEREDYRAADSLNRKVQGYYTNNYQPLGTLSIEYLNRPTHVPGDYRRRLDIANAKASASYTVNGYRVDTEYFASAPDSVIVVLIRTEDPAGFDAVISFDSPLPHSTVAQGSELTSCGYAAYESLPVYTDFKKKHFYDPGRGTRFCTIARAANSGGTVEATPFGQLKADGVRELRVVLTNATSFNGFDRNPATEGRDCNAIARRIIDRASRLTASQLSDRHIADYRRLYGRVSLDLGETAAETAALPTDVQLRNYTAKNESNPDLEELYFNFGRYLLISSSRTPGVPANLQGLWNERLLPPWSSNYTSNINLEENYWPAEVTNLPECHESLMSFIGNLAKTGRESAEVYYGVRNGGWSLGQNTDIWATTNPVGMGEGDPVWACWNMGGAWLASHIWEHYLFNRDRTALAENYPALRGAALFCLGWLVERDGKLITSPSTSPENKFFAHDGYVGATLYGGAADLAMIRQCLSDTRDAAKVLGTDKDLCRRIESTLKRLQPYKVGHKGNLQEWFYDWEDPEPTHRHQSHLYGLYPGNHISPELTPELARAASRTLEIKGNKTTGWSTGWRVNLYARLLDAENAYRMYRTLLRYVSPDGYKGKDASRGGGTYPNLFDAHSPFQIDGNFGGTAGVAEMLVQSTPTTVTLLPALPSQWKDGSVSGLKTRSAVEIDMTWRDGKVTSATLRSTVARPTRVAVNYNGKRINVTVPAAKTVELK